MQTHLCLKNCSHFSRAFLNLIKVCALYFKVFWKAAIHEHQIPIRHHHLFCWWDNAFKIILYLPSSHLTPTSFLFKSLNLNYDIYFKSCACAKFWLSITDHNLVGPFWTDGIRTHEHSHTHWFWMSSNHDVMSSLFVDPNSVHHGECLIFGRETSSQLAHGGHFYADGRSCYESYKTICEVILN